MTDMAVPPASTKTSLQQRLSAHARDPLAAAGAPDIRFRGTFAYVDGHLPTGKHCP